jgi:hypothetical protein
VPRAGARTIVSHLKHRAADNQYSLEHIKASSKLHPFTNQPDGDLHALARLAFSEGILAHLNSLGWTDCGIIPPPLFGPLVEIVSGVWNFCKVEACGASVSLQSCESTILHLRLLFAATLRIPLMCT